MVYTMKELFNVVSEYTFFNMYVYLDRCEIEVASLFHANLIELAKS